ncbi:MAG TPA: hypothetical protein VFG68_01615 [Fimbriiglobus sp.]|nr:hypothetical protein [Fimbriiglobus sp.]
MAAGLSKRVRAVEAGLEAAARSRGCEEPASVRWLDLLRAFLPVLEGDVRTPEGEAVIERVRYSICLLEEYVAGDLRSDPWAYLEYYCHGCLLRLGWDGPGTEGRQLAFRDPDYDGHIRQIEAIERARRGPPRSDPPPTA